MDEVKLENLPRFTWADFKKHVSEKKPFEAISPMGSALLRFQDYKPMMGLAIHAGHRVREELLMKMDIEELDRLYEEDEFVEKFIADFPLQMIALDSRYEYDINRKKKESVYLKPFQSWGKKVWLNPPTKAELEISYQKREEFHELLDFFVEEIEKMFGRALIFDVHSYNFRRPTYQNRVNSLPLFNLATSPGDQKKHGDLIDFVIKKLSEAQLEGVDNVVVKQNDIFVKDGEVALNITAKHPSSFVLPIEVKKIYMDENSGEPKPKIIDQLQALFREISTETLDRFMKKPLK